MHRFAVIFAAWLAWACPAAADDQEKAANAIVEIDRLIQELARKAAVDDPAVQYKLAGDREAIRRSIEKLRTEIPVVLASIDQMLRDRMAAIYGFDDRKNFFQLQDAQGINPIFGKQRAVLERSALATLAIVPTSRVTTNLGGTYDLSGRSPGLCSPTQVAELRSKLKRYYIDEPFWNEPADATCTAFKIGDRLVATAGHCVNQPNACERSFFVARYFMRGVNDQPHRNIARENVYTCRRVVQHKLDRTGADWAIVELDRPLTGLPQVELRRDGTVKVGDPVTIVGYPMGLPVKFATNATVRSLNAHHFVANLDAYGGNSGSPVYSTEALRSERLLVEGILVRGEDDFELRQPCRISRRCAYSGCRGEDSTYAKEVVAQ